MKKRLGVPLEGTGIESRTMPEQQVEVVTDRDHPVLIQDVGNLKVMNIQHWVGKDTIVEVFLAESPTRRGFTVKNNGQWTIYIGITQETDVLQKIGMPIKPNESFSSALFQGKLYVIADDTATVNTVDVRVWEEQM